MEYIKKLYAKPYHLYTIEDWKYIFSIYKKTDKYNYTEEKFLNAELIDKTAMMLKMNESIYKIGLSSNIDEDKKPLVDLCSENSCETINDFLDNNEEVKNDPIANVDVEINKFLDGNKDDSFYEFRGIQSEYYDKIYSCQNRIEEYKKKIRAEVDDIKVYRQNIDEAFNKYIK